MLTRYTYRDVTWIDLESPTPEEIRGIMDEYGLHPLVAEELLLPTTKPRVESYDGYLYLILHFPVFKGSITKEKNQEVDFIVGKNFIITTRYDVMDPLHEFSKIFEVNSVVDKGGMGTHAGHLFTVMARNLYKGLSHELSFIEEQLERVEDEIFRGHEKEMVLELSKIGRQLLNFKQALVHHEEILETFETASRSLFGDEFFREARFVMGEYYRVRMTLEGHRDTLDELRETNNSLVSTKQNEIMKIFTIMAFVTFPLSLFAALLGMNTKDLPLTGYDGDFWVVILIMATCMLGFFLFFRYKKWL